MPQIQSFHTFLLQEETKTKYPRQNQKGHDAARAALAILKKSDPDLSNYGITMTEIPKVGINPRSDFRTPIGVYFYPASYYDDNVRGDGKLPYQHDAQYINIIKFKENANVLDLSEAAKGDIYTSVYKKIRIQLKALFEPSRIDDLYRRAQRDAAVQIEPGYFWHVTKELSDQNPAKWNRIFAKLGIDVVIDSGGYGIIHDSEPTQGFLIDGTKATVIHRFDNKNPTLLAKKPTVSWPYEQKLKFIGDLIEVKSKLQAKNWGDGNDSLHVSPDELKVIVSDARIAYIYATDILEGPFPEGEAIIATDPDIAINYAIDVLDGPFPKGEAIIATDPKISLRYQEFIAAL